MNSPPVYDVRRRLVLVTHSSKSHRSYKILLPTFMNSGPEPSSRFLSKKLFEQRRNAAASGPESLKLSGERSSSKGRSEIGDELVLEWSSFMTRSSVAKVATGSLTWRIAAATLHGLDWSNDQPDID